MAKSEYQRLTRNGSRTGFFAVVNARSSLWLGSDHLLLIESNRYAETYKRFYFRDIQTFTVQKNQRFLITNVILTVPLVVLAANEFVAVQMFWRVFWLVLIGLLLPMLAYNLIRGQTCSCFVRTAVQTEWLTSLNRLRQTGRVLDRLRPLIAAAQGGELSSAALAALARPPAEMAPALSEPIPVNPDLLPKLDA